MAPYPVFLAAQSIARLLGCDVDLVDLRPCSTVLAAQVVGAGQRLAVLDAREKYDGCPRNLEELDRQEIVLLSLHRACELAIDLAMHVVAEESLGVPQQSRDAFRLLATGGHLDAGLGEGLQNMADSRNIAIHRYQGISLPVLERIIADHLGDFDAFLEAIKPARPGGV